MFKEVIMNIYEGKYNGLNKKIAIVISRFNSTITDNLLKGANDCLIRHDVKEEDIDVYIVPGAFEIPHLCNKILDSEKYNGIIALACIIRGDTYHFEIVSNEVSKGIAHLTLNSKIPISFGVVTSDTLEQSFNRSGLKSGNKGFDAALSLLEMINIDNLI
jgi:6,7-dimethyl-8-ribityllumazine synthase